MQNLEPSELEILNDFQSRLLQSKKTKELLLLSPKAYIDKRIVEIISLQTNKTDNYKLFDSISNNDENDENSYDFSKKTMKNRLIVPSIKTFESNRKLRLDEANKENKLLNNPTNYHDKPQKKPSNPKEKKKEISLETRKTKEIKGNSTKKVEIKKNCDKKYDNFFHY